MVATAVTASDCIIRGFQLPAWSVMGVMMKMMFGFRRPRNPLLGMVAAGDVEAIGKNATRFSPGDQMVDYTQEDFTTQGRKYDFFLDAVGKSKSAGTEFQKVLAPGGQFLSVDNGAPQVTLENLNLLRELVETGKLKPVIDRTYPLKQMTEAHAYVDKGHKKGNVIVSVAPPH